MISDFVDEVIHYGSGVGEVMSSPELDELCQAVGTLAAPPAPGRFDDATHVYIVTGLAPSGGHTRVLRDLIDAQPEARPVILVTNLRARQTLEEAEDCVANPRAEIRIAPNGDVGQTLAWLQSQLCEIAGGRTFLFQYNFDAVAVAAVVPRLVRTLIFYHHSDHSLALGVTLPHALHVDFHARGFENCRSVCTGGMQTYWPITVPDPGFTAHASEHGGLVTCAAGGIGKFENPYAAEWIPYSIDYGRVVPQILDVTRGTHLHIGALSDAMRSRIRDGLAARGIPADRFVECGYVPDLAAALVAGKVDLYIGSFPIGGVRGLLEAMSVGVPILAHASYRSAALNDPGWQYPEALVWHWPEELPSLLGGLTPAVLEQHRGWSRKHYELYHHPGLLRPAMEETFAGRRLGPPLAALPFRQAALQCFLDERETVSSHCEAARRVQHATDNEVLLAARTDTRVVQMELSALLEDREAMFNRLEQTRAELQSLSLHIEAVESSASWRLTGPLRSAMARLGSVRRRRGTS